MGAFMSSNSTDEDVIKALLTPDRLVIDCRSAGEFARGDGFTGAKNIPVDSIDSRLGEVGDKSRTIITYCAAGVRAARAAGTLTGAGYRNVFSTTNADHLRELAKKIAK
jgi:rhodanese-related sulfurtransferase